MPLQMTTQAFSGLYNASRQQSTNEENRDFSREMYERQRQDALTDRAFENEYNSPANQMKRLKEAGLNPNLVYGGSSTAPASVSTRSSSAQGATAQAPRIDFSGVAAMLGDIIQMNKDVAQTNLLREKLNTEKEIQDLTAARTGTEYQNASLRQEQVRQAQTQTYITQGTVDEQLAMVRARLKQTEANTTFTLSQNERAEALKSQSIAESIQRILRMRMQNATSLLEQKKLAAQIDEIGQNIAIKTMDERLSQSNMTRNDHVYLRYIQSIMDSLLK